MEIKKLRRVKRTRPARLASAFSATIPEEEPLLLPRLHRRLPRSMQCCAACLGPSLPKHLMFANTPGSAIGDASIPHGRRLQLGVIFPKETGAQPMHMFFARNAEGVKVLEAACSKAGVTLDRGRIVGSPDRLNLFTVEGDLLRVDLDLEAHLGSTLKPGGWLILEKGNRIDPARLEEIKDAKAAAEAGGFFSFLF